MAIGFNHKYGACVDCIKCCKFLTDSSYKKGDDIIEHVYFKTFDELMKTIKEKNWKTDLNEESLKDFSQYGYWRFYCDKCKDKINDL